MNTIIEGTPPSPPNTSTASRTATITITAGNLTRTHTVTQEGAPQAAPTIETTLEVFPLRPGELYALSLGFTPESGKSYRIEDSFNLKDWEPLETGVVGDDLPVERSYFFNPATRPGWFLRVVEE